MIRVVDIREMAGSNQTWQLLRWRRLQWDLRGRVTTLTGSSAAAALGAGACALLLEWGIVRGNVPAMDSITIQRYLIRGANRLNIFDYPNKTWGYGSLDLYDAFRSV